MNRVREFLDKMQPRTRCPPMVPMIVTNGFLYNGKTKGRIMVVRLQSFYYLLVFLQ